MKNSILNLLSNTLHRAAFGCAVLLLCAVVGAQAAPKRILVVCITDGFRHSAIELGAVVTTQMGKDTGLFTTDVVDVNPNAPEFKGADGKLDKAKLDAANRAALADKLSAEGLKHYDAVFFNSTTGKLPLPDVDAFLSWIKSGKGFIGVHASTDTFGGQTPLHPYSQMVGAVFKTHGAQVEVEAINQDPKHPACKHLPATFKVFDEIYQFNGFERSTGCSPWTSIQTTRRPVTIRLLGARNLAKAGESVLSVVRSSSRPIPG
jgi:hypothetical protein